MKRAPRVTKRKRKAARLAEGFAAPTPPVVTRIPASAVYGNRFERGGWVLRLGVALQQFAISRRCV